VVNSYAKSSLEGADEKMAYAGIMKQARRDNAPAKWDQFLKVKAHVDLKGNLSVKERFRAKGNDWADKEALKAEELHQPPDLHYKEGLEDTTKKVKSILNVLANVLPLWPLSKERHKRTPKEPTVDAKSNRLPAEHRHLWFEGPEVWHCNVCRAKTAGGTLSEFNKGQRCRGLLDRLAASSDEQIGHRLVEFDTAHGSFTICGDCGHYGIIRARNLAKPCPQRIRTRRGNTAWRRVFIRACHPYSGKKFGHSEGAKGKSAVIGKCKLRNAMQRVIRKERLTAKTTPWAAALLGAGDLDCARLPDACDHDDQELYADPWQDEAEDDDDDFAFVGFDGEEQVCESKASDKHVAQTGGASGFDDVRSSIPVDAGNEPEPKRQRRQVGTCSGTAESVVLPSITLTNDQAALPTTSQQGPWEALQERKRRKLAGDVRPAAESDFARLARKAANE